jgi:hypothetical protein
MAGAYFEKRLAEHRTPCLLYPADNLRSCLEAACRIADFKVSVMALEEVIDVIAETGGEP